MVSELLNYLYRVVMSPLVFGFKPCVFSNSPHDWLDEIVELNFFVKTSYNNEFLLSLASPLLLLAALCSLTVFCSQTDVLCPCG